MRTGVIDSVISSILLETLIVKLVTLGFSLERIIPRTCEP